MSDKRDRFVRLAEARVPKAMHSIRIIGNLANTGNYEYSEEDVRKIVGALQGAVNDLKRQFRDQGSERLPTFRL